MTVYTKIYPFEVMDKVIEGEYVGMLDREMKDVYNVRNLSVDALAKILAYDEPTNRFEFWIVEEKDDGKV